MTVSQEDLLQGYQDLKQQVSSRQQQLDSILTGQKEIQERVEQGTRVSHANEIALARIEEQIKVMFEARTGSLDRLNAMEIRVVALELQLREQRGRDGVIGAILRSPMFMAVAGAIGGAWFVLKSGFAP